MALTVTHEPADVLAGDAVERCCMCRTPTRYWYVPNDVAMCQLCAKVTRRYQVPIKAQWIAKERAASARARKGAAMTAATDPGRVVGWIRPADLSLLSKRRHDNENARADVYTRLHCHDAIPLVRESLLAEAESRIVNMENSIAAMRRTRDEMQGNLIALQAQVDAVREVVTNSSGHISAERILAALGEM